MAIPVLATKLYLPSPPPKVVTRSRLIDRLSEGLSAGRKLSLISAPAGFGKSTLVSEWITSRSQSTAWLSLDENDNDPTRFLIYFIHALQTLSPNLGVEILDALQSQQVSSLESILTALLNELTTIPNDFILVLDDYHLTDHKAIDDALTFLIDHLPPQIHLVITTREDPSLPIPRLRARNQLTELRAADLRFTTSEAAEFLNHVMDLRLSAEDVGALETRTEGWIAGLQLAALSMQGRQDVSGFVQSFAGDNRYIVDYLVEEVLRRQTDAVHSFLLQTAILDRLNGSLCEAVTGQPGGKEKLEALQRGNFFLIPLDDRRHWYRYHHLFADVLRMHLIAEQPEQVPVLHRRASEWYEQNGSAPDAIHHALAGADFERAAELIERALPIMRQTRQEATLLGWLQALPDEVFKHRPVLNVHYAGTLLQNGQLGGVLSRLQDVERWLDTPTDLREQPIFVDETELKRVPGAVAMYQAAIALAQSDIDQSMKYAQRVLELVPDEDSFMRGAASSLLGLVSWTRGDLETAYQMFSRGMTHLQKVGFISDVIGGAVTLADIRITQGRLRDAMSIYEHGLQLATEQGLPALRGAADMHVGMSDIYRERNDLHAATQSLMKSKELGDFNGLPKNPYRWRVAMARIRQTRGDLNEALDTLNEAEPLYVGDFSPNVRPISALKARVWIAQGRLDEAITWARQNGLSVDDDLSYLREFEYITLARLLLARFEDDGSDSSLDEAIHLLGRLLNDAQDGGRIGSVIEIRILQARAHQLQVDIPTALQSLEHALSLAKPEGYMRIFVDEGANMAQLLHEAAVRGIMPEYTGRLLSAFDVEDKSPTGESSHSASPTSSSLIEPLSQRELDILRLFKTELSGPEIAQELVIALSTVRTHTKSIYSKLNVNSRRGAVKRAMELGLI
jgi:LuxR family maltose regulon positive regulatory protein